MQDILGQVQQGIARDIPARLYRYQHAQAYFGVLRSILEMSPGDLTNLISENVQADMAIEIEEIIERRKIRDWVTNHDIQKAMMNDIEDYLYAIKAQYDLPLRTLPNMSSVYLSSGIAIKPGLYSTNVSQRAILALSDWALHARPWQFDL
jgi:hypothetical protein